MILQVRPFLKGSDDYSMVSKWWEIHKWKTVSPEFLPVLGNVVFDSDSNKQLAAGWCYLDSSSLVAMIEWVVVNPENRPKESYLAIIHLLKSLKETAQKLGYKFIFTTSENKSLIKLIEKTGFTKSDKNVTHLYIRED